MNEANRIKYLRIALWAIGLAFIFCVWLLSRIWPSGWVWHTGGRSYYFEMILGFYATLGVFLIRAAHDPRGHLSIIWFTIWSSVVHGAIMAVQSFDNPHNLGHIYGDVLVLFVIAAILGFLTPR